eukprot:TRINITY_DN69_c0_g1_i1.p1 TRINITY_DN69_c0_g1~~TRINITY_DN69_c0_g1_i1.p1  ORF type:complete len:148 (-),score=30.15 TRINITY_DN69_c0_g1_i1:83-526(-)
MRLFAPNKIVAKSRFWHYMKTLRKLKSTQGEILSLHQVYDQSPEKVKNFAISLRYRSRSGEHNMLKEYRATTRCAAVEKLMNDMAGRHRVDPSRIQILNVASVSASEARRVTTKQFLDSKIQFPLPHRVLRRSGSRFKAQRATTHFS